ncbi:MAG: hypothetical protein IKZ45_09225 [Fibrobacter sp.]|nr:hypothetical protein [Fibrobacter sp.]
MLKKFSIAVGSLFAMLVIACSSNDAGDIAGGTVDPNTFATASSSSGDIKTIPVSSAGDIETSSSVAVNEESSSSGKDTNNNGHTIRCDECSSSDEGDNNGINPIPVSSSSEIRDGGIARTNDFFIQCVEDVISVELTSPSVAADVGAPEVFRYVESDSVKFVLQNVYFDIPCDKSQRDEYIEFLNTDDTFPIGHEGDTLYVTPFQSKGIDYACSCAAKATFTLDKNYSGINYTVFGQKETLPVQEK